MTATAEVKVRPVLLSFEAAPQAAKPGETITFTWKTRGAREVTLSERSFKTLTTATAPAQADQGSFEWTVPEKLPNGKDPLLGHPLHFSLTVKSINPTLSTTASIDGFVGEGPGIIEFTAPEAATSAELLTLQWRTLNALRLQIRANGDLVYEPLAGETSKVAAGSIQLTAPSTTTDFELTVWGPGDVRATQTRTVRVVRPPSIPTFEAPTSITEPGNPAEIRWTTADAASLVVRLKNGQTVFATNNLAEVASGNTRLYPAVTTTFVLEAFNEAGDIAREERTIAVTQPAQVSAAPRSGDQRQHGGVELGSSGDLAGEAGGRSRAGAGQEHPLHRLLRPGGPCGCPAGPVREPGR